MPFVYTGSGVLQLLHILYRTSSDKGSKEASVGSVGRSLSQPCSFFDRCMRRARKLVGVPLIAATSTSREFAYPGDKGMRNFSPALLIDVHAKQCCSFGKGFGTA